MPEAEDVATEAKAKVESKASKSTFSSTDRPYRQIVSFVRRGARMTSGQEKSWHKYSDFYVLDVERAQRDTLAAAHVSLAPEEIFANQNPLIVEIGSGMGDALANAAAKHPENNYLAFEVYRPGIAQTLSTLARLALPENVRLLELDAEHTIDQLLPPDSISELWIFFADPWRKQKHHKRRLVSKEFLEKVLPLLKPGAVIRTATDWAHYAYTQANAFEALAAEGKLINLYPDNARPVGESTDKIPEDMPTLGFAPRFDDRVLTNFEAKAQAAGRLVWEFAYQKPVN